jgi:hypothetical protein
VTALQLTLIILTFQLTLIVLTFQLTLIVLTIHLTLIVLTFQLTLIVLTIHLTLIVLTFHLTLIVLTFQLTLIVLPFQLIVLIFQVSKLQREIDEESENKNELTKAEEETIDQAQKELLRHQIAKSDEKVEAMMMMMLHYCAGLQYCLDQEQEEKQRKADTKTSSASFESSSASYDKQPVEMVKNSEANFTKSLDSRQNPISCPAISVEVASSPEENIEDLAPFPDRDDGMVHVGMVDVLTHEEEDSHLVEEDSHLGKVGSHLMQDLPRSDQKQKEETLPANVESKQGLPSTFRYQSTSSKQQPEAYMEEEDILADVINTVTEIIEKSEGETDSSDLEESVQVDETHSIN